ncbi:MAG: dTDP-4-dehydrorhamnose reductase [Frankiales bacterium]|nr:dTDP-4-dehydrorhamnose reductase [Frankiales bacterium]
MTAPRGDGRWLVVGHRGMLGADLMDALRGRDVAGLSRPQLDLLDVASVTDAVRGADVVVNCAAWTAVDDAEDHEEEAFAVNALGPAHLARAARDAGAWLVQVSTDYVFAGDSDTPYAEDAPTDPRTAYGRTKAAGEEAVHAELADRSYVVRTAWLYGRHGRHFVSTIAGLARERDHLDVVDDQVGQPTWTADVAARIVDMVDAGVPAGRYHATSSGETTWFGLAREVVRRMGLDPAMVRPTTSAAMARRAPRPAYSVLGHDAWARVGMPALRHWEDALGASWPPFG